MKPKEIETLFDTEFVMKGIFSKELSKHFHKAFELRQTVDYKIIRPIEFFDKIRIHSEILIPAQPINLVNYSTQST